MGCWADPHIYQYTGLGNQKDATGAARKYRCSEELPTLETVREADPRECRSVHLMKNPCVERRGSHRF